MKNGDYCVAGASSRIVNSLNEIIDEYNKAISSVAIDEDGFYLVSHLFFIINVETFYTIENSDYIQSSFLKLVDFAGTENKRNKRWKKGPNFWANAIEMMTWNNFPVDLGRCIISLTSSRSRPYYTESIITQLLKDSFGRNSHTAIIATISQIKIDFNETISTLRYAEHMKKIKNKPETNIFKIEHHSIK
ncbi:hypothetical protein TRFO_15166 [Tritrichomonas foetus]|uniref:Kinesin motor domain-containing protein n=1 Tax=Tritrichomonas foetus TaxID=1144522 RepID=A0A1J4KT91_9EUKA|nr:hypothetical protein TRFO_15166 [Tritrichomonas foetus]|eukprot:OHT14497.1 hypothetical protein TRFO_15166 [Tritrichomonas foetus]